MVTMLELPPRECVGWLAHRSGQSEADVLALTLLRVRDARRGGLAPRDAAHLAALERLLKAEIDLVASW